MQRAQCPSVRRYASAVREQRAAIGAIRLSLGQTYESRAGGYQVVAKPVSPAATSSSPPPESRMTARSSTT